VIEPGARAAVAASRSLRIGVLGTAGTIASGAYPRAVLSSSTRAEIIAQAAPLLVPLVEEGWLEGDVPRLAVRRYLEPLARAKVDVVVLGCTHYPLLRNVIEVEAREMLGDVRVVDGAQATAEELAALLDERELQAKPSDDREPSTGNIDLLVTDRPRSFADLTVRFLGGHAREVEVIDL
jgi:glutamate racemase